jgi:hypothetical protein
MMLSSRWWTRSHDNGGGHATRNGSRFAPKEGVSRQNGYSLETSFSTHTVQSGPRHAQCPRSPRAYQEKPLVIPLGFSFFASQQRITDMSTFHHSPSSKHSTMRVTCAMRKQSSGRRKVSPQTRLFVLTVSVGLPLLIQAYLYTSLLSSFHVNYHSVFSSIIHTPSDWQVQVRETTEVHTTTTTYEQGIDITNNNKNNDLLQDLPDWIQNYLQWHQEQRLKFPGNKLFTDPAAPKLLIRTCYQLCGGLHDRLGKLPWDLYLANQTGRVLLMNWCHPAPLQEFLLPNLLDWTVPLEQEVYHNATTCQSTEKSLTDFFDKDMHANRPRADFWTVHLDNALQRATTGKYKGRKILRHRILGDEAEFKKRMVALGERDVIDWTPTFGKIFWIFFRPSPGVQKELDTVFTELDLQPGHYSAVHCRVRHPKAQSKQFSKGKTSAPGGADRVGLLWEGASRDYAVETAVHALQCGQTILPSPSSNNNKEPIYFYSDSEDLVRFMSDELKDPVFLKANASLIESNPVHKAARQVVQSSLSRIVGRPSSTENLHIDRQGGYEPAAYYGSFVDLLIGAQSRCVTYGVGNYALFASKISGSNCRLQHQEESWGVDETKEQHTKFCVLNSTIESTQSPVFFSKPI